MISVDLNKKLKVNPEANGNLSLAIVDKSINKIIYVEEDFNKPVELNQSYYLDLMFLVADKDKKEHYSFNMPVLNTIVVEIHSRALGDQIAWLPIVDEFQKNMNCKVVLRCYFDKLFRRFYPNLDIRHQYFKGDKNVKKEYIEAEAVYILGYAVNGLTNDDGLKVSPIDCRTISLQEVACHQLGLEPKEIRPSFKSNIKKRLIKKKIHSNNNLRSRRF